MAVMIINYQLSIVNYVSKITSGGYCGRVPPLPIPNREVKPACADGTAMQCGRVGSRLLSKQRVSEFISEALFFDFHQKAGSSIISNAKAQRRENY